jgi:hypothetical protein
VDEFRQAVARQVNRLNSVNWVNNPPEGRSTLRPMPGRLFRLPCPSLQPDSFGNNRGYRYVSGYIRFNRSTFGISLNWIYASSGCFAK